MKIKDLLKSEEDWCQEHYFIDKKTKHHVSSSFATQYPDKCSFCLMGALSHCYGMPVNKKYHEAFNKILSAIPALSVSRWNDDPFRKFEEVKELVNELDI